MIASERQKLFFNGSLIDSKLMLLNYLILDLDQDPSNDEMSLFKRTAYFAQDDSPSKYR